MFESDHPPSTRLCAGELFSSSFLLSCLLNFSLLKTKTKRKKGGEQKEERHIYRWRRSEAVGDVGEREGEPGPVALGSPRFWLRVWVKEVSHQPGRGCRD